MSNLQQLVEALYRYYHRATSIALELPTRRTKKGKVMPNYELPNDEVDTITIKTQNAAGATEPVPTGDVFSVASDKPASLGTAVGKDAGGNPAIVLTPLVQVSPGIAVTVSDTAGLKVATLIVDIVQDVTPTNIVLDTADATHVAQPVPTAPGP
jgi:hypothetical protein